MFRKLLTGAPLAALVIALLAPDNALSQERLRHPRLHAALYELVKARQELNDAGGRFGGHRKMALEAMDGAIGSIRTVLNVRGDDPNVVVRKPEFYRKHKGYPHLRQVLADLREARQELRDSRADFRGRIDRAEADIDVAIKHVKLAIDHAD